MCGFAAFFRPGYEWDNAFLHSVGRDLFHRGPDSEGITSEPGAALVFRRLAIMDPEVRSDQPMSDDEGLHTLVFNGEIYNHVALRAELESSGERFVTGSDTEVILRGYRQWGEGILDRLEGMYAFALVDRRKGKALVARDPFGIKPLYMIRVGDTIAFASEMRCLTRLESPRIDEAALAELLTFGWAAGSMSNLQGIERVIGGTCYRIDLSTGAVTQRCFTDVTALFDDVQPMATGEAEERISEALEQSVRQHLMSDVGYALQLSGGVDSSVVAAIAGGNTDWSIASYSVDIGDHPLNEKPWRNEVVDRYGLEHHELPLGGREYADAFESAVWHMEGPVPHLGCVMIRLVCRAVRDNTKVVLTGEGADEMFGGYERYSLWKRLRIQEALGRWIPPGMLPNRPPFLGVRRGQGVDGPSYASVYADFKLLNRLFPSLVPRPGYRERISARHRDYVTRIFAVDQTCYLESLLVRQDKMAMAESVEARVPFVHLPLARLLNSVPRSVMSPGGITKPLLKKAGEKFLSKELLYRRKNGLLMPYGEWLRDEQGLGRFLNLLEGPDCRLAAYAGKGVLKRIVDKVRRGVADAETRFAMRLVNMELWLRTYDGLATDNTKAA